MRTTAPLGFDSACLRQRAPHYWHQQWEVFPGVFTPGRVPVSDVFAIAQIPADLTDKRVIDIGAWNGCGALECERRGAKEVVALSLEAPTWGGFNLLAELTGAGRTRFVRGTIYNLNPDELGLFDIVICFGVIYHLRYPVLGLDNLRRVATGTLYLETHLLDDALYTLNGSTDICDMASVAPHLPAAALMQFYKGSELQGSASNWFSPSMSALSGLLETAGFTVERTHKHAQRGYVTGRVNAGYPPFMDKIEGQDTYEGQFYDLNFSHLFGGKDQWKR
jgi:tRNA (mo5U34)-methyltransferase